MVDQPITTKEIHLAYLRGEVSFEVVEQSASDTLTKYRRNHDSSKDTDQS